MNCNNLNLHPGGLINQRLLFGSNTSLQHHTEEEEEMNIIHTSDMQSETITNHNSEISPSNIIKKVRKSTENLQKSMKDFFKGTTYSEEKDNNPKHHKDQENNHQGNSFIRINSTKSINILINNTAGMAIKTNKLQQIINFMEENHFDIILAQEANVKLGLCVCNKIVNLHNNLLLKMRYKVMIEDASCKKTFQSTDKTKIHGTGEGCGNSPIIWLLIYNILIRMFSREAIGANYKDNNHTEIIEAKISAYVDDVNTHHTIAVRLIKTSSKICNKTLPSGKTC
jgi:hypothetical protein